MKRCLILGLCCLSIISASHSVAAAASAPIAKPVAKSVASSSPLASPQQTPAMTLEPKVKQSPPPVTTAHQPVQSALAKPEPKSLTRHRHHTRPSTHLVVKKSHAKKSKQRTTAQASAVKGLSPHEHHSETINLELAQVRGVVDLILTANANYMKLHSTSYFKKLAEKQVARATVLTCADSREQTDMMHPNPEDDLFVVRNIGNQMATAPGSIEYGIRHLHTPLLMIIGHSACGAVMAAASDYAALEPAIRKEIATINIPKGIDPTNGALLNINNQVEGAILNFAGEVESGKLAIIGAFYDFRNDLQQGYGKLVITNINGETDPEKIRQWTKKGQFFKVNFVE